MEFFADDIEYGEEDGQEEDEDDDDIYDPDTWTVDTETDDGTGSDREQLPDLNEGLLRMATPSIYRANPFRLLQMPTSATARELRKRAEIVNRYVHSGTVPPSGPYRLVADEVRPEPELTEIMRDLDSPEWRLVNELFWFWSDDWTEARLRRATIQALQRAGAQVSDHINGDTAVAIHDQAVLLHHLAIRAEEQSDDISLGVGPDESLQSLWIAAYEAWRLALMTPEVWEHLEARVSALGDRLLKQGETTARLRHHLPSLLVSMNAEYALRYAEKGQRVSAHRHRQILATSGFDQRLVDTVLLRAVAPVRQRLKLRIEEAGEESDSEQTPGDRLTTQLVSDCHRLLDILEAVLGPNHPISGAFGDQIGELGLAWMISFGNRTHEWTLCCDVIETLLTLITDPELKQRADTNLELARGNARTEELLDGCMEIVSSTETPQRRYDKLRRFALPRLGVLQAESGDDNEGVRQVRNTVALLFNRLALELNNESEEFDLAIAAIMTAKELASDPELVSQLQKGLVTVTANRALAVRSGGRPSAQTNQPTTNQPATNQSGCFVATAAYGDPDALEVRTLRQFRDKILRQSRSGRSLIRLYYRTSPPFAALISKSDLLRSLSRSLLRPIVWACQRALLASLRDRQKGAR